MIAAPGSGSGKTMITCALLESLKKRGYHPISYKCGPDYIDPMFHSSVIGVPSRNLDLFFVNEMQMLELYEDSNRKERADIAVVEGVMGLYDGVGGVSEEASCYHVASVLQMPIVLVVNARGMGRSLLPLLAGFLQYDRNHLIKGVILNQTTRGFYEKVKRLIEQELPISVLGFVPRDEKLSLESRHLGLRLPSEIESLQAQVEYGAALLEENVKIERLLELAGAGGRNHVRSNPPQSNPPQSNPSGMDEVRRKEKQEDGPVLAVAKDEAFCFYYEDNLQMLEEAGVRLSFFSPLHDHALPEGTCGLLIGGGYPECRAKELSENTAMREAIHEAIRSGMPSVAECGGFMYLQESLEADGVGYPMVGVIPGTCKKQNRLVRFGYVEIREKEVSFLSEAPIRAHEFHYYDSEQNGEDCIARKQNSDEPYNCIHVGMKHWWGYPHLYYRSNPGFVRHFVEEIKDFWMRRK